MITIYTKTNAIRLIVNDSDDSQIYQELSGEEYVTLSIKIDHYVPFSVGDYITVFGNVYSLKKIPAPVDKNSTIEFIYTLKFESSRADLGDVNFQLFDNTTIDVVPAYNPANSYQIGNVCAYRDLYWECISPVTNIAPAENDYWALRSTVTNYVQPYNDATTYSYGDIVQYDYNYFKHIGSVDTVGVTPIEGDNWTIIRTAPQWDFSITLTPQRYAQLVVDNMRRARPKQNWIVGYCMPASPKVLSFSCVKCLDALGTISEAFETEFWIDGYSVNIGKRAHSTGLTFKYGENNGLENITRGELSENKKVTRLIALGGTQNLLGTYRNGSNRLMLPNRYYLDADNIDLDMPLEDTQIWEDIFPSMSHATDDWDATKTYHVGDQVVYNGNSWDALQISTNITPSNGAYWQLSEGTVTTFTSQYKFIDANLTFNPLDSQYIMADGTKPKVRFITGNLAGYDFPISSFDVSTKTITIEQIQDGTDSYLPTGAYTFKQGDQYVLIDLYMPQIRVNQAEQRLLAKAQEYIDKYSVDQVTYSGNIDVIWATNNAIDLNVGDVIHMQDDDYGINTDYRITVCKRGITNPYKYEVTLSSAPYVPSKISSIKNKTEQNETYIDMNDLKNINTKAEKLSKTSSLPLYKGDWSPDGIYIGSNIVYNIVKYNDKYYRTKTSVGAFSKETSPDQDDMRWTLFQGTYETLATGLLLAEVAYIDNLIVEVHQVSVLITLWTKWIVIRVFVMFHKKTLSKLIYMVSSLARSIWREC
jgi:chitodextrinase